MLKYVIQYIWDDKILRYLLLASLGIVVFMVIYVTGSSASKERNVYWIDKGVPVLAFIGNPHSLKLKPVRFTTSEKQPINLFHKKSGPGIYAFYLPELAVQSTIGKRTLSMDGYFLVKRRLVRTSQYKKKVSLKSKTFNYMKGDLIK